MRAFLYPFTSLIDYFFPKNTNTLESCNLIYFDFETTGLNPYHNKIIEYAFIQEEIDEEYDSEPINEYNTYITDLVNPKVKFDKKISEITGIHPDELINEETIYHHIKEIMNFINYDMKNSTIYLVAHNCDSFDKLFLINAIKKYNKKNPNDNIEYKHLVYIDTLNMAKKLLPNIRSYSLKNLAIYFNIKDGQHRALSDTVCLRHVYHNLVELLSEKINMNYDYIIDNPSIVINHLY
jgi:DNA polymerase III subunit epsilon